MKIKQITRTAHISVNNTTMCGVSALKLKGYHVPVGWYNADWPVPPDFEWCIVCSTHPNLPLLLLDTTNLG